LEQNYPNPFNPSTFIKFSIPQIANVELVIYNVLGQKVRTLVRGKLSAGFHQVVWDGTNDEGWKVSTGVYLLKMKSNDFIQTRKMMIVN